jgi:surface antigen
MNIIKTGLATMALAVMCAWSGYADFYANVCFVADPANAGSFSGGGFQAVGSSQQICAYANDGWIFVRWDDGNTSSDRYVTIPDVLSIVYTAYFSPAYWITVRAHPVNGGSVVGNGTYASGSPRTVTATARSGYTFANWTESGSVVSYSTSYPFTLNANRTLVANFTANTVNYTVTSSAGANGSISPSGVQPVNSGGSIPFTATPANNYVVDQWFVDGGAVLCGGNNYTLGNVTANRSVRVTFKIANSQSGFNNGDRVKALGSVNAGINVRSTPPALDRLGTYPDYDQRYGVHGTITGTSKWGSAGGVTTNWWPIKWDSGNWTGAPDGWCAESAIALAPTAGDVDKPEPDFPENHYYTTDNKFWWSGNAPKYTQPPDRPGCQLGNAKGNCTWYAYGRMLEKNYDKEQLDDVAKGNARDWANNAGAKGIPVSSTPRVGSIAQQVLGNHVAVVESVNDDGTITVTESVYTNNPVYPNNVLWRHRTVSNNWFENYIYIDKELSVGPVISANGTHMASINSGDPLNVSISLNVSSSSQSLAKSQPIADWWVIALAGSQWYYLNSSVQWTQFDGNLSHCHPVYQGALFNLPATDVLSTTGLPVGNYIFWFVVSQMDGVLDINEPMLVDSANVIVQ